MPRLVPFLRPRLRGEHLHAQRDMLLCVAKTPLDDTVDAHLRMLMSIFKALTGNARDPPRYGAHWDMVGFQGTDPATDLRGVGMLSLLNALYLVTRRRPLAQGLYALSRGERDFPFMTVSINLTKVCIEALRCGALTAAANERNSAVDAFHELHAALYAHMAEQWRTRSLSIRVSARARRASRVARRASCDTRARAWARARRCAAGAAGDSRRAQDFGQVLKELHEMGTKRTSVALRKLRQLDEQQGRVQLSDGEKLEVGAV